MMSFEQDRGVWSDARMFDVAKGVLVTARRCGLDEALTELVGTAERHHMKGVRRVAGPGRARCRGFRLRRPRCHRGRPRHLGTPVRQAIDTMNTTTDRRVAGSNAGPARRREFGRNADLKRPPTVGGFGGSAVLKIFDPTTAYTVLFIVGAVPTLRRAPEAVRTSFRVCLGANNNRIIQFEARQCFDGL